MNKKKLLEISSSLSINDQQTLLDFALFLAQKNKEENAEFPKPHLLKREKDESVIGAIKRLKKSYFMLNMDTLLDETSTYMAQYMVQGREKNEVIDDLEKSFSKHYQRQKEEFENA